MLGILLKLPLSYSAIKEWTEDISCDTELALCRHEDLKLDVFTSLNLPKKF